MLTAALYILWLVQRLEEGWCDGAIKENQMVSILEFTYVINWNLQRGEFNGKYNSWIKPSIFRRIDFIS